MRILFITATRLGDAVLSTGVLRHLIETHPAARITVACGALPAPLFAVAPQVETVIPLVKQRYAGHWRRLWQQTVGTVWDLVVDLRHSPLSYTLLTKRRATYRAKGQTGHKVEQLGRVLGLDPPPDPTVWFDIDTYRAAQELVGQAGPVLAVAPAANWRGKTWRARNFSRLVDLLTGPAGVLPGARVMVQAAEAERAVAEPVLASIPAARRIDMVGAPVLLGAACIGRASLFVGNDSGLMHIAAACGVPTLGLFGPSRDDLYRPWGPHGAVVRTPKSMAELIDYPGYNWQTCDSLMDGLTVEAALAAAETLWRRCQPAAPALAGLGAG